VERATLYSFCLRKYSLKWPEEQGIGGIAALRVEEDGTRTIIESILGLKVEVTVQVCCCLSLRTMPGEVRRRLLAIQGISITVGTVTGFYRIGMRTRSAADPPRLSLTSKL
jgi:hypothetical protein